MPRSQQICDLLPIICCNVSNWFVTTTRRELGERQQLATGSRKRRELFSQPDALGLATRSAGKRLREAGIALEPLLSNAGISASQLRNEYMRIGVANQIKFLELASKALKDPLLGFRIACDSDFRQIGLLYYVAASSDTLGEALRRMQRYSSLVNAGVVLQCSESSNLTIALSYFGVARHSDRQQMELLVTIVIRLCRALPGRHLKPKIVRFAHRRSAGASELEKFYGCKVEFGRDLDEIILDRKVAQLCLVGADRYLNKILLESCEQALGHRRSNASSLRVMVENVITPLLPHGKARLEVVASRLGMSSRTLARRLSSEGLRFGEILSQLRSDLAMHYLQERELSISEIAWLVGYQDVGTFSHRCKQWTGVSPKSVRRQYVGGQHL